MEYRVEGLARAAGVRVDTVRFYQARGLLPAPKRVKREAVYSAEHLETLRQIRRYQAQGLSLAVIKRLLKGPRRSKVDALLFAVAEQGGERRLGRAELAERSGASEAVLAAIESAGLLSPALVDGEPLYGETDLQLLRAALDILRRGLPLPRLLDIAVAHDRGVREVAEAAVDLFDRHAQAAGVDGEAVTKVFRELLPAATTLVALHFQRTLLARALERLRQRGEGEAAEAAQQAIESGRLEVIWR